MMCFQFVCLQDMSTVKKTTTTNSYDVWWRGRSHSKERLEDLKTDDIVCCTDCKVP